MKVAELKALCAAEMRIHLRLGGNYSKYCFALIEVAKKCGIKKVVMHENIGDSVGRVSYDKATIWISDPGAHTALVTIAHELGHWLSFLRNGRKEQPDKDRRELLAYYYGWVVIKAISAEHLVPRGVWRYANGFAPFTANKVRDDRTLGITR